MNNKFTASALFIIGLGFASASTQAALIYNFSGSDKGGTGSATMAFKTSVNTLTVTLNNTSPTRLNNSNSALGNAPGITGFGFNLDPSTLVLESWTFRAHNTNNSIIIGSNVNGSLDWGMNDSMAGVEELDYLLCLLNNGGNNNKNNNNKNNNNKNNNNKSNCGGMDGALFNPGVGGDSVANALLPGGGNSVYFTAAVLTMNFNKVPSLNDTTQWSPFVRMQNVGLNGEGSLKLSGTPGNGNGPPPQDIPEPGMQLLLGAGLAGLSLTRRRRRD